jgi:glycosyltransferase involved in cell wall biosynthesis
MKILYAQETDWFKRSPIIQHHLFEILTLRGYEVRVIDFELLWARNKYELFSKRKIFSNSPRIYPESKITVIRPGIIKIPILDYVSESITHYIEINRQMKEWSPDIIIGSAIINSYFGAIAARKAGIPFIYYWLELNHLQIPIKQFRFLGKIIEKITLKHTDKLLATSENLKKAISEMGFPVNNIQVLESGVSINQYNPNNTGDLIRNELNINKDDIVLIFVGWLYHFSGLKEVLTELSKQNNPKIKLIIVGEGDAYAELKKLRSKYKLENKVILTGQKPLQEIPQYLAAADICILPAYNNETMRYIIPGKIYEYMAASKPVISTNLPGILNKFGLDNGITYVNHPEDVVWKAIELAESGTGNVLGLKARKLVEQYSWDNIADQFEKIIDESVKKRVN